jgi:hypothetical protein
MTFTSGSATLGTVSFSGLTASLITTGLPLGLDSLTAVYSGNSNFAGSRSNIVTQYVNFTPGDPGITGIYPNSATVGGEAFYLTVYGTGFVPGATVYWGSAPLATRFRSSTKLTAEVPSNLILNLGTASVAVTTPAGASNPAAFAINLPPPTIGSLAPNPVYAFMPTLSLTINGTNFTSGATVHWWTVPLNTTFVNANQITVEVPPDFLGDPGKGVPVTVETVSGVSNSATLNVLYPLPAISGLAPSSVGVGAPAFTLDVSGHFFYPGSTIYVCWECTGTQTALATTFVDAREVTAPISASMNAAPGWWGVTVVSPYGTSSTTTLTISP